MHVMKKGIERAEEGRGGQLVQSGTPWVIALRVLNVQ